MKVYQVKYSSRSGGRRGFSTFDSLVEAKARIAELKARGYRAYVADIEDREDWTVGKAESTEARK